jgi:hypothetical protein
MQNWRWPGFQHPLVTLIFVPACLADHELDALFALMPLDCAVRVHIEEGPSGVALRFGQVVSALLRRKDGARAKYPVSARNTKAKTIARRTIADLMNDAADHGGTTLEIGLDKEDFALGSIGKPNPVDGAVELAAQDFPHATYMLRVRASLVREVLRRAKVVEQQPRRPAFITGRKPNKGGATHRDAYHAVVMVVAGAKGFLILPPDARLPDPPESDAGGVKDPDPTERDDLSPVDGCNGADLAWRAAYLEAGDLLYLPPLHWHWVISTAGTVMTNVWYNIDMASPTPQSWYQRAMAYVRGFLGVSSEV